MSLKNILNHEPPPLGDQSPIPDSRLSPLPSPASLTSQLHSGEPHSSRIHHRSSLPYENLGWDSRSTEWNVDDHTTELPHHSYEEDPHVSPIDRQVIYTQRDDYDLLSRKRRKGDHNAEYLPTKPRRVRQTFIL